MARLTQGKTVCEIAIKVNDEWIWKADGAGDTIVQDRSDVTQEAIDG